MGTEIKSPTKDHIEENRCPCADNEYIQVLTEDGKVPPYFPQSGDAKPVQLEYRVDEPGPQPAAQVSRSPTNGMAGVAPVLDSYSITQSGQKDWKARNLTFIQQSTEKIREAHLATSNAKQCVNWSYKEADKIQLETKDHLKTRTNVIYYWKTELEHALADIVNEIESLNTRLQCVKQSLCVLKIPEAIVSEFLKIRSTRAESEMLTDDVENELVKEGAVCSEVRNALEDSRKRIESQLTELLSIKMKLESDWSDKLEAYNIDTNCIKLTNDSPLILWKPGAARFPPDQSTISSYDAYSRQNLTAVEAERKKSVSLRSTLNDTIRRSIKALRDQATRVDMALAEKIKVTEEVCQQLEKELGRCLKGLANTEKIIEELRHSTNGLNSAMKLAQTRLANRLERRNLETCRDHPQYALLEEVKTLNERISAIQEEQKRTDTTQAGLVKARGDLEREILAKRRTLYTDKERGLLLRSFYPSATALSGF